MILSVCKLEEWQHKARVGTSYDSMIFLYKSQIRACRTAQHLGTTVTQWLLWDRVQIMCSAQQSARTNLVRHLRRSVTVIDVHSTPIFTIFMEKKDTDKRVCEVLSLPVQSMAPSAILNKIAYWFLLLEREPAQ